MLAIPLPFLNGIYSKWVEVHYEKPLLLPLPYPRMTAGVEKNPLPSIPSDEVYDLIAALWVNYIGVKEVGFAFDSEATTFQWTDLEPWQGSNLSVQIILKPNGDFQIRSGRCSGDNLNALANSLTGYQATDGAGGVFSDTIKTAAPCNLSLEFVLRFQQHYVSQFVSDWLTFGEIVEITSTLGTQQYTTTAVSYGVLVPPVQGEVQYNWDGVVYQGTQVIGHPAN